MSERRERNAWYGLTAALLVAFATHAVAVSQLGDVNLGPNSTLNGSSFGGTLADTLTAGSTSSGTSLTMSDDDATVYGTSADVFAQGELSSLTDGSATTVFSVVMGDGDMAGLAISYTIQFSDGSEYQSEHGEVLLAIVDDAGGVVASVPVETSTQALSTGTLTSTWAVTTTDDQSIEVTVDADTSLTPTTNQIRWHVIASGDVTLTVP